MAIVLGLFVLSSASNLKAEAEEKPHLAGSPLELINAVNELRVSSGLAPYSINSILMATAQAHADYMAATGTVSHMGLGGTSVTGRLLAAGYPLAGDLSLGGFRPEYHDLSELDRDRRGRFCQCRTGVLRHRLRLADE